jgi:hypothetical protein
LRALKDKPRVEANTTKLGEKANATKQKSGHKAHEEPEEEENLIRQKVRIEKVHMCQNLFNT